MPVCEFYEDVSPFERIKPERGGKNGEHHEFTARITGAHYFATQYRHYYLVRKQMKMEWRSGFSLESRQVLDEEQPDGVNPSLHIGSLFVDRAQVMNIAKQTNLQEAHMAIGSWQSTVKPAT